MNSTASELVPTDPSSCINNFLLEHKFCKDAVLMATANVKVVGDEQVVEGGLNVHIDVAAVIVVVVGGVSADCCIGVIHTSGINTVNFFLLLTLPQIAARFQHLTNQHLGTSNLKVGANLSSDLNP